MKQYTDSGSTGELLMPARPAAEVSSQAQASAEMSLAVSTRGMVTSPHTLASEAGLKVLRDGGNAMEAAIAIGAVIAVTYPHFCGIGGDAIWIVADRSGRNTVFTGIGQAAEAIPHYQGTIPLRGPGSTVASAGAVDTWQQAHDYSRANWNGKLSFASLLDPAIDYAENGFPVTSSQLFWHNYRSTELADWHNFCATFMPNGRRLRDGETFVQVDLARSLKSIARNGARDFYEGELANKIAKGLKAAGSPLTAAFPPVSWRAMNSLGRSMLPPR